MTNVIETNHTAVTRSASKVMLGGVLALFGSLTTNIFVAALFGAGASMDAYLTALVIPGYFQIVFYSSLSFVLIPAFIDMETKKGEEDAWALIGTFFWLVTAALLVVSILGFFTSSVIIGIIAPGFEKEKANLATEMLSVLIFTIPFSGLSILTAGIQNTRNRFFWPSAAPAFGSLVNLIIILIFSPYIGPLALSWGYFLSIVLQCGFTAIPVLSHGWKKRFSFTHSQVKVILKMTVPLILFGLVVSLSPLVERYYASGLPNGQISYMGYANKISNIFVIVLASGIAAAIFPSMARAYSLNGEFGLAEKSDFGMRLTIALALPTVLIIGVLATPLVSVFFERGAFNHVDTLGVSRIIFAVVIGDVLFRMIGNILQRSLYVLKDTRTQPIVSSILMLLFITTLHFFVTRWGYIGIVWARVARGGLEVIIIWGLSLRKLPKSHLRTTKKNFLAYCIAAVAASICVGGILFVIASAPLFVQLMIGGLVGMSIYLFVLYLLDKEMLTSILEVIGFHSIIGKYIAHKKGYIKLDLNKME